jgi:hypothetical protein
MVVPSVRTLTDPPGLVNVRLTVVAGGAVGGEVGAGGDGAGASVGGSVAGAGGGVDTTAGGWLGAGLATLRPVALGGGPTGGASVGATATTADSGAAGAVVFSSAGAVEAGSGVADGAVVASVVGDVVVAIAVAVVTVGTDGRSTMFTRAPSVERYVTVAVTAMATTARPTEMAASRRRRRRRAARGPRAARAASRSGPVAGVDRRGQPS